MNIIRLPQFLNTVDKETRIMSHEELEKFIHEIARKLPERQRSEFLDLINQVKNVKDNDNAVIPTDNGEVNIIKQISSIIPRLILINDGELRLDSEYNEEWDDWYSNDEDEILFSDPEDLLDDIREAIWLVHKCVDMELLNDGCKLCETLCYLEISADGDYDYSSLELEELFRRNLLSDDFEIFMKESLYLIYAGTPLSHRASAIYRMFEHFNNKRIRLEDILQMGNHELPEFDEFLPLWIDYLGKQSGRCASELLQEAQSMIQDDFTLLQNARKYVNEHPELYLQLLQMKVDSNEDEKMLSVGMEAVDEIPVERKIRSIISLWTAYFADKLCMFDVREKYWLEALRSDTSVINYMRIKFLPWNGEQYTEQVSSIVKSVYEKSQESKKGYYYVLENIRENYISKNEYCCILFFEKDFDNMEKTNMLIEKNLGWSATFMKEGMALLMLLLYQGESYSVGMKSMLYWAIRACGFSKESLYFGTTETNDKTDTEIFCEIFDKWKDTVTLSNSEVKKWMNKIETWICRRVSGIMEANKRNYYRECAEFIAALGEVKESIGEKGAKAKIMEQYRTEYSRRRAFHQELRNCGMKM